MNRFVHIVLIVGLLLAHLGCERRSDAESDSVLIKCGNETYSARAYTNDVKISVEATVAGFARRKSALDEEKMRHITDNCRKSCLQVQLKYMLAKANSVSNPFVVSSNAIEKVKARYRKIVSADTIAKLESQIWRIAYFEDFVQSRYGDQAKVTENEIDTAWSNVLYIARMADATNAVLMATASNIVRRARCGEDFAKLAECYSQDQNTDADGFAPQTAYSDFDNEKPGVKTAIMMMNVGDVTAPLDSDEGLSIYRLAEKGKNENGEIILRLQRISFHRMIKFNYDSKDDLGNELRQHAVGTMRLTAMTNMLSKCRLEFPSGFESFTKSDLKVLRPFSKDVPKVADTEEKGLRAIMQKGLGERMRRQ